MTYVTPKSSKRWSPIYFFNDVVLVWGYGCSKRSSVYSHGISFPTQNAMRSTPIISFPSIFVDCFFQEQEHDVSSFADLQQLTQALKKGDQGRPGVVATCSDLVHNIRVSLVSLLWYNESGNSFMIIIWLLSHSSKYVEDNSWKPVWIISAEADTAMCSKSSLTSFMIQRSSLSNLYTMFLSHDEPPPSRVR